MEFVGHPLDRSREAVGAARRRSSRAHGLTPSAPTVAILPGSRAERSARASCRDRRRRPRAIRAAVPGAQFVVARAPHLDDALFDAVRAALDAHRLAIVDGDTDTVLASADVALTASGTATVQTALHDTPMVIVYRVSPLSYQLLRRLVSVDAIGMVNLIAGERIVPELVQDEFTPEAVAREAISMLTDRERVVARSAPASRACASGSADRGPAAAPPKPSFALRRAACGEPPSADRATCVR